MFAEMELTFKMGESKSKKGLKLIAQKVKNLPALQETRFDTWVRKIPEGGNGNPLQYSCLENSMDRGAWWATGHGVAKSWTRLSD